jgi:hypothetical protein
MEWVPTCKIKLNFVWFSNQKKIGSNIQRQNSRFW